jgi:septal ring factor EnvC (AmiA/AmiB activator)
VIAPYPEGARGAAQRILWPLAAAAPIPLPWTGSVSAAGLIGYEAALLLFYLKARSGRPLPVSNRALNLAAILYCAWFVFEIRGLHHGLVRTASHLLLFTAAAKFASLRSSRELRTALLLSFFLALDSASTATHAASLLYLLLFSVVAFRALARLAVLADFGSAPPRRALRAVPTAGLSAASVAGIVLLAGPLFVALPRLRNPFATVPIPKDSDDSSFYTSDRVDLESFSAAKRSDRIVLRVTPIRGDLLNPLRLRETTFNRYRNGHWWREGMLGRHMPADPQGAVRLEGDPSFPAARPSQNPSRSLEIEMSSLVSGFLFLPYGAAAVVPREGVVNISADSAVTMFGGRRGAPYRVDYEPQGAGIAPGHSVIWAHDVPEEVTKIASNLALGARNRQDIAHRLLLYFRRGFVYTLDPPAPRGEPIVDFLTRTRAGHCEYFASAMALMLRSQGIPARLAAGSLGGEISPLSSDVLVRGGNLHAWVEADIDGKGFRVLDPTPPDGRPGMAAVSLWRKITQLGNAIEFFYDRNVLGFDAFDQANLLERARELAARAGEGLRRLPSVPAASRLAAGLAAALLFAAGGLLLRLRGRRAAPAPAAAVYLSLRALHRRAVGPLGESAPSASVVKGFASLGREPGVTARRIVEVYRRESFGGIPTAETTARELKLLLRHLGKIVKSGGAAAIFLLLLWPASRSAAQGPNPSAAAPGTYEDLKRLQARVEESRKKLAEVEKTAASLKRDVQSIDLQLQIATEQRELIAVRRNELVRQNAALSADLAAAARSRDVSAQALRGRIALLSRLGRLGYLRILLSARSAGELFSAVKVLDAMARSDARALSRFTETSRRLEGDLSARMALQKQADQLLGEDREQERRAADLKEEKMRLLVRSQSTAVQTRKEVEELSEKARKLEALLDMLSRGESTATGSPRPWKGVLPWPAQGKIAVTFGRHRHPKFDAWTVSNGIEILAPDGEPVTAVHNGKVVFARWFADYGNMVVLDHGDEVLTLYARLRSILVRVGDVVSAGAPIGLVGTGPGEAEPSLYFEVRDRQKASDPLAWLR